MTCNIRYLPEGFEQCGLEKKNSADALIQDRGILSCQLLVVSCQLRVASCQFISVSCQLVSVSCYFGSDKYFVYCWPDSHVLRH